MNAGLRRTAALIGTVVFAMLLFSPPVAAQKGAGGLFPPGTYNLSFTDASLSDFSADMSIFLDVSAGTDAARPDGGPQTTTSQTELFLNMFDYSTGTFTFACLILDHPSDFTVDNRLGGAVLDTALTPSTPTCPQTPPLTTTLGIRATWAGVGPLANSTGVSNYTCAGYKAQSSGHNLTNTAVANVTVTTGTTSTTFPPIRTTLNANDFRIAAQGTIDPGCGPAGFGTGPTPAGHYRFNGLFADGFFTPPTGDFNQISLYEIDQSSQLIGGPAVNQSEFDLNLSFFGGSINGFGCFAIPRSDVVANGLTSASLRTTVTGTPLCSNSYPGFGLDFPLTVSAAWTGTGPVMTVHDQNNYKCLGYTQTTATFVENRGADSVATVTMPDYSGNPQTLVLTDGFGSLTQVRQTVQANGVLPEACFIRV